MMEDFSSMFRRAREEGKKDGIAARMMADDGVTPEEGHAYTISPDFVCGDRSYTRDVLRILKLNETHAVVECVGNKFIGGKTRLLSIADRAWFLADDLAEVIESKTDEPEA